MSKEQVSYKQQARLLKLLMKTAEGGLSVEFGCSKFEISYQGRNFSFPKPVLEEKLARETIKKMVTGSK